MKCLLGNATQHFGMRAKFEAASMGVKPVIPSSKLTDLPPLPQISRVRVVGIANADFIESRDTCRWCRPRLMGSARGEVIGLIIRSTVSRDGLPLALSSASFGVR